MILISFMISVKICFWRMHRTFPCLAWMLQVVKQTMFLDLLIKKAKLLVVFLITKASGSESVRHVSVSRYDRVTVAAVITENVEFQTLL